MPGFVSAGEFKYIYFCVSMSMNSLLCIVALAVTKTMHIKENRFLQRE
jgi:hypothetical protein